MGGSCYPDPDAERDAAATPPTVATAAGDDPSTTRGSLRGVRGDHQPARAGTEPRRGNNHRQASDGPERRPAGTPALRASSGCRTLHWLAPLRLERGWSDFRLAAEADVHYKTIRRAEAGRPAELTVVLRLASALEVPSQVLHAPPGILVEQDTGLDAAGYARKFAWRV